MPNGFKGYSSLKQLDASPSSHSSFCEEVFPRRSLQKVGGHKPPLQGYNTNEVDRTNILAPGIWFHGCRTPLLPAFTGRRGGRLARGKSYPVTAAQLLPIHTGFLAPIHGNEPAKTGSLARKELAPEVAACTPRLKIYLSHGQ
jgi:hypothetical protein